MSHYKDLRELYAKSLEYHGIGRALFQPVASADMSPPCCGYFDRNGDFNLIANISTDPVQMNLQGLEPLEYLPPKVADIGIEWQPKTSLGVQAITLDGSANTPDNLPGGADAHIKYKSDSSFGAVLMTRKPITLTAYNDERLFLDWLEKNKPALLDRHGQQLKRYGMWIVTRTHSAPSCWINAWHNKKREAIVSVKAKANMLGGIGNDFSMDDNMTDRDWTHYLAKDDSGIVVFMDGIEVGPYEWKFDGFKQAIGTMPRSNSVRRKSLSPSSQAVGIGAAQLPTPPQQIVDGGEQLMSVQLQSQPTPIPIRSQRDSLSPYRSRSVSNKGTGRRSSASPRIQGQYDALVVPAHDEVEDERMMRDLGITNSLSRTASSRPASLGFDTTISRSPSPRTPSLRHETRSIYGGKDGIN